MFNLNIFLDIYPQIPKVLNHLDNYALSTASYQIITNSMFCIFMQILYFRTPYHGHKVLHYLTSCPSPQPHLQTFSALLSSLQAP